VIGTIAGRLFLSYLAVVAVGLLVASIAIASLIVRYENEATRQRLLDISQPFLVAAQNQIRQGRTAREVIQSLTEQARTVNARIILVSTQQRRILIDSEGRMEGHSLPPGPSGDREIGTFREGDEEWVFVQRAIGPAGTIVVARPRAAFAETVRALLPAVFAGAAVAAAFALLVAALLARTITRPLRELVAGARRFAQDQRARVAVGGPREVRELGSAFNEMADEVERARGTEQAFLADISHELRTPLTSIQGFSQAIVEGEVGQEGVGWAAKLIQREAKRLIRMVEGLLQVARLEAGRQRVARERVALAEVVHGAVAALDVQAKEAGVEIRSDLRELPPVIGDADRLAQLFINVLDNAVKHSPRGAWVEVLAAAQDAQVVVRVRDQGGGIPAGSESRVFQRFYRGESERDGAGLGLAIAQAIAQAHGGRIEARNVEQGAEFQVVLPAARPQ